MTSVCRKKHRWDEIDVMSNLTYAKNGYGMENGKAVRCACAFRQTQMSGRMGVYGESKPRTEPCITNYKPQSITKQPHHHHHCLFCFNLTSRGETGDRPACRDGAMRHLVDDGGRRPTASGNPQPGGSLKVGVEPHPNNCNPTPHPPTHNTHTQHANAGDGEGEDL